MVAGPCWSRPYGPVGVSVGVGVGVGVHVGLAWSELRVLVVTMDVFEPLRLLNVTCTWSATAASFYSRFDNMQPHALANGKNPEPTDILS